jgi:hypothetical protein
VWLGTFDMPELVTRVLNDRNLDFRCLHG